MWFDPAKRLICVESRFDLVKRWIVCVEGTDQVTGLPTEHLRLKLF